MIYASARNQLIEKHFFNQPQNVFKVVVKIL